MRKKNSSILLDEKNTPRWKDISLFISNPYKHPFFPFFLKNLQSNIAHTIFVHD